MMSECCIFSPSSRRCTWIQVPAIPNESVVSQTMQNLKVKRDLSGHKTHSMKTSNGPGYSRIAQELAFLMNMRSESTIILFESIADISILVAPYHVQMSSFHGYAGHSC